MYINGNFLFLLILSVYSCFIMLLVSVAQQSESATRMYTHIPPLFGFPLQLGHHRALSRVSLMHGMFYVKVLHNCKSFPIKKFHKSKGVLFFFFFPKRNLGFGFRKYSHRHDGLENMEMEISVSVCVWAEQGPLSAGCSKHPKKSSITKHREIMDKTQVLFPVCSPSL